MIVNCFAFRGGERLVEGRMTVEEAAAAKRDHDFVWLEVADPPKEEVKALGSRFDLPELAVEDAYKAHQRPKVEQHGRTLFMVLRTLQAPKDHGELDSGEIHLFVEDDFVIVVRHGGDEADLEDIRERVEQHPELLRLGPTAVVYAVVDEVVDDYEPVIEAISDDIDETEQQVFSEETMRATQRIFRVMREVVEVRRSIGPLIGSLEGLHEGRYALIPAEMRPYFRDIHDHVQRAHDRVEGFRDLLSGMLEANTALVTVRQNDVVRKISGWAAIIAVPTLISGIYGMNFEHMPELKWTFGYPFALSLMLLLAGGLYALLRRVRWL